MSIKVTRQGYLPMIVMIVMIVIVGLVGTTVYMKNCVCKVGIHLSAPQGMAIAGHKNCDCYPNGNIEPFTATFISFPSGISFY